MNVGGRAKIYRSADKLLRTRHDHRLGFDQYLLSIYIWPLARRDQVLCIIFHHVLLSFYLKKNKSIYRLAMMRIAARNIHQRCLIPFNEMRIKILWEWWRPAPQYYPQRCRNAPPNAGQSTAPIGPFVKRCHHLLVDGTFSNGMSTSWRAHRRSWYTFLWPRTISYLGWQIPVSSSFLLLSQRNKIILS